MRPKLFVYGTLKTGQHANSRLRECTLEALQAVTFGKLYNLGFFPGMKIDYTGEHLVQGELYSLPIDEERLKKTLTELDAYEGHPHLFRRQLRMAYVDGVAHPAWVYVYNHEVKKDPIPDGLWARETKQQKEG